MNVRYTAESVRSVVIPQVDRLFAFWAEGRPANWSCDTRTRELITLGKWLDEELTRIGIDDLGRRTQTSLYNRESRSRDDLYGLVASIMNDALDDKIDRFRRPHRRWG